MLMATISTYLNWDLPWLETSDKWPVVVGLMIMSVPWIIYQANEHGIKIAKNKSPNHTFAFLLRLIPTFGYANLLHAHNWNLLEVFLLTVASGAIFGLLFNPLLNDKLHRDAFSVGETAKTDILLTKWFGENAGIAFFVFCLVIFGISTAIYVW
jgi:hypothetical protein